MSYLLGGWMILFASRLAPPFEQDRKQAASAAGNDHATA